VSDGAGQGAQLLTRHQEKSWQRRWAAMSNVLCIRFRGFDPDRLLTRLNCFLGWIFSPAAVLPCLLLMAASLMLVTVHFDVFRSRLPAFHEFFGSHNWLPLALTLAVTKMLHEFAHGLACKRFGGECHEMGFMLLVLTPCLYCNVSDSWMLRSKWQRAAIGAAGMYVELALAAMCTMLWWLTQPCLLNYLCLNVMFVCSVSTLLFNANPLMRYDGYYILADVMEIPNLRQKASAILRRKLAAWTMGLVAPPDPFLPQRRQWFFAVYSMAAAVYRWFVVLGILWFLYRVFEPYGLQIFGQVIAVLALYGLAIQPLWHLAKFLRVPGRIEEVKAVRLVASLMATSTVVAAFLWVPLPHYVRCSLYLEPRDAAAVYVESPGHLRGIDVQPGDWVRAGQPLVRLENTDLQLAVARLEGESRQFQARLASFRRRALEEPEAALEITETQEAIASLEEQLAKRRLEIERLRITAPVAGTVLAPPTRPGAHDSDDQLASWSGSPLQRRNLRAYLEEGVGICRIGDPRRMNAILAVDQADLEFVHVGQRVDLILEQQPGRRYRTQLEHLSQLDMKVTPQSLSHKLGGSLQTRSDPRGGERPASPTYQAAAPLDGEQGWLFPGATGQARIHAGRLTIASRVWRYVCETFKLDV
jgi:putative peptide zinc metalloprotease protein